MALLTACKLSRDEIVKAHPEFDLFDKVPLGQHQRPAAVDVVLIFIDLERQMFETLG